MSDTPNTATPPSDEEFGDGFKAIFEQPETEKEPEPHEEEVVLSLVRAVKPIKLADEVGTVKQYLLREMTGVEKDDWLNGMSSKIDKNKVKDFKNMEASLIARCLYDPENRRVPIVTISNYPASTQRKLFKLCETLNGLDVKGREEAKND